MAEKEFPWHEGAFSALSSRSAALPHALLLHGRPGIGKTGFARAFAAALLCEGHKADGYACGQCDACRWFEQGNHPDFRQVEPEYLSVQTAIEGESTERSKEPSKQIKIEQVRELQSFLAVGTHRAGRRVAIVRPAEAMNIATANALLKSLEEPPPQTVFLLVSSQPARLLPTIRSRCQMVSLPGPDAATAAQWLCDQGMAEPEALLAHCGNAPLAALEAADTLPVRNRLLNELARGECDPLSLTDACADAEPLQVVEWLQKWAYDLAAVSLTGMPRYHPHAAQTLQRMAEAVALRRLLAFQRELARRRAIAQHPLNPRLFLEELFMQYRALRAA